MHVRTDSFTPFGWLDDRLAFCKPDPDTHVTFSDNRNPHLAWSNVPAGTKSFALICVDTEVPTEGSRVNREGMTVPLDLERAPFYHWVLVDLPADLREIAEGSHASGVTPRGKPLGPSPSGGLQGRNDYTGWFAGDPDMGGTYAGYDGPCPPWNDERIHCYFFRVYALDVPTLGLSGDFGGADVVAAVRGHVLAEATVAGLFTFRRQ